MLWLAGVAYLKEREDYYVLMCVHLRIRIHAARYRYPGDRE